MPTPDNPKEIIDIFKELDAARVILEKLRDAVITINIEGEKTPAEISRLDGEEKQAITTVLHHLSEQGNQIDKLNTEINKLNNVIDRMAEVLSDFDYDKQCEDCRCDYCNAVEDTDEYMKCIKEYFMKEDK